MRIAVAVSGPQLRPTRSPRGSANGHANPNVPYRLCRPHVGGALHPSRARMSVDCVERRFGSFRVPHKVQWLSRQRPMWRGVEGSQAKRYCFWSKLSVGSYFQIDRSNVKGTSVGMSENTPTHHRLTPDELAKLAQLREQNPAQAATVAPPLGLGDRIADRLAATVGSWRFIIVQSVLLGLWIILNFIGWIRAWDPYPFILLNLVLSFQAAYTAPIIMMSQNRQAVIDRHNAETDYKINVKAELEIELLHQKVDLLREQEMLELVRLVTALERRLAAANPLPTSAGGGDSPIDTPAS